MKQSRIPHFISGWLLYISALKLLWKELHEIYNYKFLRTRNLSQDCLEHFFSKIRWKNGNNYHPDAALFSSAYKALVINHLVIPNKIGNVEADLSKYIINRQEVAKIQILQPERKRPEYLEKVSDEPISHNTDHDINKLANIHWTTGWAISKITHKDCLDRATSEVYKVETEISFLSDLKKYQPNSRIITPGEKLFQFFTAICRIFEDNFDYLLKLDTVGVKEELIDIIQIHFNFSNDSSDGNKLPKLVIGLLCEKCALKIINKYLNMLISCKLAGLNSSFKAARTAKKKKQKNREI